MRHFLFLALAIALLAGSMAEATARTILVAAARGPNGSARADRAHSATAVDIAPVTVATDHHLAVAANAVEKTGIGLHRQSLPKKPGSDSRRERYSLPDRVSHGCGHGTGG